MRLFNTYGPRQTQFVVSDMFGRLRQNPHRLEVLGTGEQVRTYNFVGDAVHALLIVGIHPAARGHVFNVAGDEQVSIRELAALVSQAADAQSPEVVFTGESWPGDVMRLVADTSRLRNLGWSPRVGLREGLLRFADWHRTLTDPT